MVEEAVLNAAPENEVQTMKVLIVCEKSQIVCKAFRAGRRVKT